MALSAEALPRAAAGIERVVFAVFTAKPDGANHRAFAAAFP